jgi:hypothetical protein
MKSGRGILFLIAVLFGLLALGNVVATCSQPKTPSTPSVVPVCTSTVSCELPPPKVVP